MLTLHKGDFLGNINRLSHDNGITACITEYTQGDVYANSLHYHDHAQLYFILSGGSVEKRKNGQNEQTAGSLLYYHAGEPHQNIRQGKQGKSLNIEIETDFLRRYSLDEAQIARAVQIRPHIKFTLLHIYKELLEADDYTAVSLEMLLLAALQDAVTTRDETCWPKWAKQVRDLLHENCDHTVSLKELAAATGVNPITISKHFPKYFSCTLGQHVRKLRVEKALSLIRSGDQSLTSIAFACGFADQSHFIRSFKEFTGFRPLSYRRS